MSSVYLADLYTKFFDHIFFSFVQVLGTLVSNSGFEDIVYQAGVCTSGGLLGVMKGSHYNRAWFIHNTVSKAMERLLMLRFFGELNIQLPSQLAELAAEPDLFTEEIVDSNVLFVQQYEDFKDQVRRGVYGKTPQYWLQYMDLMKYQHMPYTAVQTNDFNLRVESWEKFLPFHFAFNMVKYARYGSYYVHTLKNMETLHPGLKDMFEKTGLYVQAQDCYPVRTALDQRGEQTINRDAKTSGGIKAFSRNSSSVLKWYLNRSEQATNTKALDDLAGLGKDNTPYKPLRPSQILKSESLVGKVQAALENEYLNPFDTALDQSKLYNLSSGSPLKDESAEAILKLPEVGYRLAGEFTEYRLFTTSIPFHAAITRNNYETFSKALKTVTIKKNNKVKVIEVNRNIINSLLSFTNKSGKSINFEAALKYPLSPVPLSIANADGRKRKTNKAKLKEIIYKCSGTEEDVVLGTEKYGYVLDMIAQIRTMSEIPETFEGLFNYCLIVFFLLVDANHCFLRSKKTKKGRKVIITNNVRN